MKDNKDNLENEYKDNKKREIEFRGKCENTNKWEYGLVGITKNGNFLINNSKQHFIDENTLGQFTGLCDKNGKKIYEGDIVQLEEGFWGGGYNYVLIEENENYAVYYDKCGRFDLKTEDKNLEFKSVAWHQLVEGNVEVIGNIYENPELLGGSDEECDN